MPLIGDLFVCSLPQHAYLGDSAVRKPLAGIIDKVMDVNGLQSTSLWPTFRTGFNQTLIFSTYSPKLSVGWPQFETECWSRSLRAPINTCSTFWSFKPATLAEEIIADQWFDALWLFRWQRMIWMTFCAFRQVSLQANLQLKDAWIFTPQEWRQWKFKWSWWKAD